MAKPSTALGEVECELDRLRAIIDRYHDHQTDEGKKHASQMGAHVHDHHGSCPDRAAIVRASMDVTRSLARLRREHGLW